MSNMNTTASELSTKRYLLQFTGAYAVCVVLVILITTVLNFDVPNAMGIITVIAATTTVIQSFVKREGRVPTKTERVRFAVLATVITLIITALLVGLSLLIYQINPFDILRAESVPFWGVALIAALAAAITWVVIYFFSGFMAKQAMKQIEKAKTK
jgi:NhaP-type Na+/H+ or K+/H+ antiporter